MKKGFTLIELLAVIVILAIIALIAVPIIIDIIEDSKKEALKRSAENYLKAVELAIAKENLNGEFNPNSCTITSGITKCGDKTLDVTVDGELPDSGEIMLSNGTIDKTSETFLTYNDKDTLTYDENRKLIFGEAKTPQVQEKYVYMWYTGGSVNGPSLNSIISPEDYSQTAPTDKNYYLKFKLNNTNIVTNSYACSVHNEVEYCLEGGNQAILYGYAEDPGDYTGNMLILKKLQDLEISCTFGSTYSYCVDGNIVLEETGASVTSRYRDYFCTINDDGSSRCFSMI